MLQRLISPFREFGPLAGGVYVGDRLLQRLSPHLRLYLYELMVQPIGDAPLLPERLARAFEFREIREGDPEIDLMPARPEIKASRFAQKATCLGAYLKGRLVGYVWFCFRAYEEDEVRCTFVLAPADASVFDFDLYVMPEHRMGLGFVALWHGTSAYLRARGVRMSFSRLTRTNVGSRRAHAHLDWKRVGQALFLKAWRVELVLATLFPFAHLSWSDGARVRLTLRSDVLDGATPRDAHAIIAR